MQVLDQHRRRCTHLLQLRSALYKLALDAWEAVLGPLVCKVPQMRMHNASCLVKKRPV